MIVGGTGADILEGGAGSDLILAGDLHFHSQDTGNRRVFEVWRSEAGYGDRVAMLRGTITDGLNAPHYVSGGSVLDDSDVDQVFGESDEDWLLYDFAEDLVDVALGEEADDIGN